MSKAGTYAATSSGTNVLYLPVSNSVKSEPLEASQDIVINITTGTQSSLTGAGVLSLTATGSSLYGSGADGLLASFTPKITEISDTSKSEMVELDSVVKTAAILMGLFALLSMGAFAATGVVLVHPVLAVILLLAAITFGAMTAVKRT